MDTTVKAHRFSTTPEGKLCDVEEYDVLIPVDSLMVIDVIGLHMNRTWYEISVGHLPHALLAFLAIYWGDDVAEFKPERFIDTDTYRWPRDACESYVSACLHPLFC